MTQTNATAKVSFIKPGQLEAEQAKDKPKAQVAGDGYESADTNAYKALVNGEPKAEALEGGVLEEMFEADSEVPEKKLGYYDQMQDLLGGFMVGDTKWKAPEDTVGDIPSVPDFYEDILKLDFDQAYLMEPVISRYAALEEVLEKMVEVADSSLDPRMMSQMSTYELRSMDAYKRKLIEQLSECKLQRDRAERYLERQREMESSGIL